MSDTDWKAAMNSEVFRGFVVSELQRIQNEKLTKEAAEKEAKEQEAETIEAFAAFERQVRESPEKLRAFRALKDRFATDADYKAKTNPLFVEAVMLLNLDE